MLSSAFGTEYPSSIRTPFPIPRTFSSLLTQHPLSVSVVITTVVGSHPLGLGNLPTSLPGLMTPLPSGNCTRSLSPPSFGDTSGRKFRSLAPHTEPLFNFLVYGPLRLTTDISVPKSKTSEWLTRNWHYCSKFLGSGFNLNLTKPPRTLAQVFSSYPSLPELGCGPHAAKSFLSVYDAC